MATYTNTQPIKNNINYEQFLSNELKKTLSTIWAEHRQTDTFREIDYDYFLCKALSISDCLLYKTVNSIISTLAIENLQKELENVIKKEKTSFVTIPGNDVELASTMKIVLSKSNSERCQLHHDTITSEHILLSILKNENLCENVVRILKQEGITYEVVKNKSQALHDIIDKINSGLKIVNIEETEDIEDTPKENIQISNAKSVPYCEFLNDYVTIHKKNAPIGRKNEIDSILSVLGCKNNCNPLIIGDEGVGKTCIIEGIACLARDNKLPNIFRDVKIYRLNCADIMSGTQLRGMFESRINNVIKSISSQKHSYLFINNIDTIFGDASNKEYNISGLISEALSENKINVIATTTPKGYKTFFEKNKSITRFFQTIKISRPSVEDCIKIMEDIKPAYERFHKVKYTNEALNKCVVLCERYITEKSLPSSAIDILDEAGSNKKIFGTTNPVIEKLQKRVEELKESKEIATLKDDMSLCNVIDNNIDDLRLQIAEEEKKLSKLTVDENDIAMIVSKRTGIPVNKVTNSEREKINNICNVLKKKIIGQDNAIDIVSQAIKRNKVGLSKRNRPTASIMCVGKTGVGKTLLAKTLAKEVFGDDKYLVRFDMSEYADKTAINKLIGASAGYIGYDNGGLLTEAVKHNKYSVLLFDELEKASTEIFNTLLQILDEGFLTDNTGNKVDFRNTIIILTSNVGAKESINNRAIGFNASDTDKRQEIIEKEMKKKFPPEFINRIDEIVYFNDLTDDDYKKIIVNELNKLGERLEVIDSSLSYDDTVVDYIFNLIKEQKEYGARPINRTIQKEIENKIADELLLKEKQEFNLGIKDNTIILHKKVPV